MSPVSRTLTAAAWAAGWWLLWRMPAPAPPDTDPTSTLSVLIPARNEAAALPGLLASLADQCTPPEQVIVVDDHSADGTAAVARAAGATVLAGAALPGGWTGKTWALHQAAQHATGDLLLFVDADVTLADDALRRLRGEHARRRGLVSVEPFHVTERPYERLSAIANVVTLMGTGAFSGWPRRPAAMAFGPCLLIGRTDYDAIGGHAHPEVRGLIAEDVGIARRARQRALPISILAGGDVVRFRMYPDGPRQLVEGWTKVLAYGAGRTPAPLAALTALWVTGAASSALGLLRGRGAVGYAGWVLQVGWMLRRVGRFGPLTALLYPAPLAAFLGLFARSWLLRLRGRPPTWRGRVTPR